MKFKNFILQIIFVGTKTRYGILVPNSKRVYPICPINNGMLFAAIIDIRGMLQKIMTLACCHPHSSKFDPFIRPCPSKYTTIGLDNMF